MGIRSRLLRVSTRSMGGSGSGQAKEAWVGEAMKAPPLGIEVLSLHSEGVNPFILGSCILGANTSCGLAPARPHLRTVPAACHPHP